MDDGIFDIGFYLSRRGVFKDEPVRVILDEEKLYVIWKGDLTSRMIQIIFNDKICYKFE